MDPDIPLHDHGNPADTDPRSNDDTGSLTDTEVRLNVDHGLRTMDTEPSSNINIGLNMDLEPTAPVVVTSTDSVAMRCINCGADVTQRRSHNLNLIQVQSILRLWIAPRLLENESVVCHSCWTLAVHHSRRDMAINEEATTSTGHRRSVCVNCGCSLLRIRSHRLHTDTEREGRIRNTIMEWISPRQLRGSDQICHPCWQRVDRAASHAAGPPLSNEGTAITLPLYTRASDTQRHCFFPECHSTQRLAIPIWLRVKLFTDYKFYVPKNCRICTFHLHNDNWEVLSDNSQPQPNHSFTTEHIQDFASFVNERQLVLDFSELERMSDELLHFWIGLSKDQFTQLYSELPRLGSIRNGKLALGAYLLKLRTGDSDKRIATLLNTPRSTLMRLMGKARRIMQQDFVSNNLGINNITREQISERNLILANGLFGGEDRKPIVIIDGTYLYVQKSSNYMYQKDTYSLHKYRNLMKPFLIVCSDGYIVDVLGPYPATTSDADIMSNEFNDETKPLRQYFQPGDVFILDRGFRDSVPLLSHCNYSVHMPASLQQGEFQLSTIAANKSRSVTVCRWVVEAVNGIFKQSFKLLRHLFFNCASTHAMTDFRIAAAIINRFHLRVRDREDAAQILEIINANLNKENTLADFVLQNNLNRRRADFLSINVNINNVSFPRMEYHDLILIACGTYQLKQARSYYGEHIREDGSYTIEVCRDTAGNPLDSYVTSASHKLLRGKIHSRHINRKVYFVYIIYQNNMNGREAIKDYYCNCMVGRRTVGCCAHVITIIWFLSWARYQEYLAPPAQFLDNILLTYESE